MSDPFHIFSLGSNDPLAEGIARELGQPLGRITRRSFDDGEWAVEFGENLRRKHVFLVQSTNQPDSNFLHMLIAIDAARRASAGEITGVIPYFGYARQDRKPGPRQPITAKMTSKVLETVGMQRLITMELHANQHEGFFDIPVDNLYARIVFAPRLREVLSEAIATDNLVIVAPDSGAVGRARSHSMRLMNRVRIALFDKNRTRPNQVEQMTLVGDVQCCTCLIVDDLADSFRTLAGASQMLVDHGAKEVYGATAHGVLSGNAIERLESSCMKSLFITDTILQARTSPKIEVVSVAWLFAETIRRVESGESVSSLFADDVKQK